MTVKQFLAWLAIAIVAMWLAQPPHANAEPSCSNSGGSQPNWYNPCTAVTPPWWSDQWRPTNGIGGTYGPGGYTPCTYDNCDEGH